MAGHAGGDVEPPTALAWTSKAALGALASEGSSSSQFTLTPVVVVGAGAATSAVSTLASVAIAAASRLFERRWFSEGCVVVELAGCAIESEALAALSEAVDMELHSLTDVMSLLAAFPLAPGRYLLPAVDQSRNLILRWINSSTALPALSDWAPPSDRVG